MINSETRRTLPDRTRNPWRALVGRGRNERELRHDPLAIRDQYEKWALEKAVRIRTGETDVDAL